MSAISAKPAAPANVEFRDTNVPVLLRDQKRWVCWRPEVRNGRVSKVPFQALPPSSNASTANSSHWASFSDAVNSARLSGCGIGFVMTDVNVGRADDECIVGIDLDGCIDDQSQLEPWAREILDALGPTYTEISPSGRGLRVFALGNIPYEITAKLKDNSNPKSGIEFYDGSSSRYLTVTGNPWPHGTTDLRSANVEAAHKLAVTRVGAISSKAQCDIDAALPEAVSVALVDQLAREAMEVLDGSARDLFEGRATDDRSAVWFGASLELLQHGFSPEEVWSIACHNEFVFGMALEHRGESEQKAKQYLWGDVQRARGTLILNQVQIARMFFDADAECHPEDPPASDEYIFEVASNHFEPARANRLLLREDRKRNQIDLSQASAARFLGRTAPPLDWLIPGVIQARKEGQIFGPGGASKSHLMLGLAFTIASGENVLGMPGWDPRRKGRVVILTAEEDEDDVHRRVEAWLKALRNEAMEDDEVSVYSKVIGAIQEDRILIASTRGKRLHLVREDQRLPATEELIKVLVEAQPDLVFLDPLSSFHLGSELSLQSVVEVLREITRRVGCATCVLHHTNKTSRGTEGARKVSAARGGTDLGDGCRFNIGVASMSSKEAKDFGIPEEERGRYTGIEWEKVNDAPAGGRVRWLERVEGGVLRYRHLELQAKTNARPPHNDEEDAVTMLREYTEVGELLSKRRFVQALMARWRVGETTVERVVGRLLAPDGPLILERLPKGDPRNRTLPTGYVAKKVPA